MVTGVMGQKEEKKEKEKEEKKFLHTDGRAGTPSKVVQVNPKLKMMKK